jgi:hypothetical protein
MNFRQSSNEEVALLLQGLRAIWVADSAVAHAKLVRQLEGELALRGLRLAA